MRGTITLIVVVALFAALCSAASDAVAGGAPAERWRTIVTPHFQVHYHEQTAAIAQVLTSGRPSDVLDHPRVVESYLGRPIPTAPQPAPRGDEPV